MIVIRLSAILILSTMLIGCADLFERKLRVAQKLLDIEQPCSSPGTSSNVECRYRLTLTMFNPQTRIATGHIPKDVIAQHQKDCQYLQEAGKINKGYDCPDPATYPEHIYVFKVDPSSSVTQGGTYNFRNQLHSDVLILDDKPLSSKQGA